MKFITLFFILISGSVFSQNIYGDWNATCSPREVSKSAVSFCDICDFKMLDASMEVFPFELKISENTLTAIFKKENFTCDYFYSATDQTLSFKLKDDDWNFKVTFNTDDTITLTDDHNNEVLLKRK